MPKKPSDFWHLLSLGLAFLAGYGAAQAVPGPLFTFAAYLGSVVTIVAMVRASANQRELKSQPLSAAARMSQ